MILKIHLIISVLGYIFFLLTRYRVKKVKERKGEESISENFGIINHIRLLIIVLIPMINILVFLVYINIFCFKNDDQLLKSL